VTVCLPTPIGWRRDRFTYTGRRSVDRPHRLVWVPCGNCWGQLVSWEWDPETRRYRARTCVPCAGTGTRLVDA
jgi:hypothetical protein